MKLQVEGVSELVLEVQSMERAVSFWSDKLGFPIVDQWSYNNGQFDTSGAGSVWATWLYVGGNTRLGLWLPRNFSEEQLKTRQSPISEWKNGLYDEGGIHVHFALYIKPELFEGTVSLMKSMDIDLLVSVKENHEGSNLYFKDTEGNIVEFYTKNMRKEYGRHIGGRS
ncbi:VOC family protein [Paenibacillus eucommiae]|uniref:Catechol-2,3-dioxygenase n=1 Tax=Paenibacillus eucommiae TaxID=1355755 RepID=A0ABS4J3J2_9BACL|nr:VOC family protein [Paenibacillus eucommiae]MBP1994414.1 catechol-2,3-dioxygenase [Paenibacillus eucommiae]